MRRRQFCKDLGLLSLLPLLSNCRAKGDPPEPWLDLFDLSKKSLGNVWGALSAASGILAGINAARQMQGKAPFVMPADTVMGALARYISDGSVTDFQPMGANFGILPPLGERIRSKQERYEKISQRGLESARKYIEGENEE